MTDVAPAPASVSEPNPAEPGGMSALRFMLIAATLTVLVLVALGVVVFLVRPQASPPERNVLQEVTMPDGSILSLEAVTFGRHHSIDLGGESGFFGGMRHIGHQSTARDEVGYWLTRRDPRSGEPLDFDWWSHSVALDAHGCEIYDGDSAHRNSWMEYGSSSMGSSRPFPRLDPNPYRQIAAFASFPRFRPPGDTFKLRVYDVAGTMVAEFDAPYPDKTVYPTWTPEPLPATKRSGDLSLTLNGVTAKSEDAHSSEDRDGRRWALQFDYEVAYQDRPTDLWNGVSQGELTDPLGNTSQFWNCELCPHEPAWKLTARVFPNPEKPQAGDAWTTEPLPIPEDKTIEYVSQSQTLHGIPITVTAVGGGKGTVTYTEPAPSGSSGSRSSSSGSVSDFAYDIDVRTDRGQKTTLVSCGEPHVRFRLGGAFNWGDYAFNVRATDDQGRELEVLPANQGTNEDSFVFVEPLTDSKTISLVFIVQQGRTFEFLVAPPLEMRQEAADAREEAQEGDAAP